MNIKKIQAEILAESNDMTPVHGFVDVDVPIETLWQIFSRPNTWHRWNHCFLFVTNRELILGEQLICFFEPIRNCFLYKMPAIAKIIELKARHKVTWEVTFICGFYARHTYYMKDLGNGRTRFGCWEKATGWSFRLMKWFWIPHFVFVKNCSLEAARRLEQVYSQNGFIYDRTLPRKSPWKSLLPLVLLLVALIAVSVAAWFYLF
jgi:hypothetical protein